MTERGRDRGREREHDEERERQRESERGGHVVDRRGGGGRQRTAIGGCGKGRTSEKGRKSWDEV